MNGNRTPWNTGNKIESHLGITRLNTMQTLIMLCLKDKESIWEEGVTEQKPKSRAAGTSLSSVTLSERFHITPGRSSGWIHIRPPSVHWAQAAPQQPRPRGSSKQMTKTHYFLCPKRPKLFPVLNRTSKMCFILMPMTENLPRQMGASCWPSDA